MLIALAVVGIAMTAAIQATSQNILATAYLEKKMVASWVGMQALNEIRLGLIPLSGDRIEKHTTMLDADWYWQANIEATANNHIQKLFVNVSQHEDRSKPLATFESYIYNANE